MNLETQNFVDDNKFDDLYQNLCTGRDIKAQVDPEILKAIGLIIVKFQRLEHSVREMIGILANIADDRNLLLIFTAKASFGNLLIILKSLMIEKGFHRKEDLLFLIQKAGEAEQIRNQIVHSLWTSKPRLKIDINAKKGLQHKWERYTPEQINSIAEQIDRIDSAIGRLMHNYIDFCHNNGKTPKGVEYRILS
jgi:hypothetical protein